MLRKNGLKRGLALPAVGRLKDYNSFGRLALIAGAVFVLAWICLVVPRGLERSAPIWLSNALMLAVLRTSPRSSWPTLIAVGAAANLLANLAAGDPAWLAAALAGCNVLEYGLAAVALARLIGPQADIGRLPDVMRYILVAAAAASASAVAAAAAFALAGRGLDLASFVTWALADMAGLVIVTPCLVILLGAANPLRRLQDRPLWPLILLTAVTLLAFAQTRFALAYLIVGALVLVTWRLGLLGAAVGTLITLALAAAATAAGLGPFAMGGGSVAQQMFLLHAFLIVCFSLSLPVAVQRRRGRKMSEALAEALAEAKAAEARYRLMAERVHDLIVRTDPAGRLLYVSPSCRAYGYTPEELVGTSANDLLHPDDRDHHAENLRRLFAGETPPAHDRQHRFRAKDGRYGWLEGNPTLLRDGEGRPVEVLNVLRNVDDHKQLEAELSAAREEAEAAARAKSDFLANMSHELRTPLTSVVGFTRLALDQPGLQGLPRSYVERVNDAGEALLSTVNDILDFSKLEAGEVTFRPQATPLAPLLRASLALFEPQAGAKDIALRLESDLDPELAVLVDPDRLRQVLLNLVGNAVKFTQAGNVTLRARYEDTEGRLRVDVEDTGPGIAEADQARLFRRFSQVDGSLSRGHSGTGLGLAICKGIVEALGGKIGLQSRPGEGSTFSFTLPLRRVISHMPQASAGRTEMPHGLRILVVDDHAVNRELASLVLAGLGADVSEAADGSEAVELAALWPYDVILMDLRMPGLDGEGALRRIRSAPGPNDRTPVLAFTADATPELEGRLIGRGFQGVVGKPVCAEALFAAVAQAIRPLDVAADEPCQAC